jgi:hypothetical protein
MADNSLPERALAAKTEVSAVDQDRRRALKRVALVGLPVVLATVRGRTAWAADPTPSCRASANMSSCGQ